MTGLQGCPLPGAGSQGPDNEEGPYQEAHEEEQVANEAGLANDVADAVGAHHLVLAQRSADLLGSQLAEGLSRALHRLLDEDTKLHAILQIVTEPCTRPSSCTGSAVSCVH